MNGPWGERGLPSPSICPVLAPTTLACAEYKIGAVAVFKERFEIVLATRGPLAKVLARGWRARSVAMVVEREW